MYCTHLYTAVMVVGGLYVLSADTASDAKTAANKIEVIDEHLFVAGVAETGASVGGRYREKLFAESCRVYSRLIAPKNILSFLGQGTTGSKYRWMSV